MFFGLFSITSQCVFLRNIKISHKEKVYLHHIEIDYVLAEDALGQQNQEEKYDGD